MKMILMCLIVIWSVSGFAQTHTGTPPVIHHEGSLQTIPGNLIISRMDILSKKYKDHMSKRISNCPQTAFPNFWNSSNLVETYVLLQLQQIILKPSDCMKLKEHLNCLAKNDSVGKQIISEMVFDRNENYFKQTGIDKENWNKMKHFFKTLEMSCGSVGEACGM